MVRRTLKSIPRSKPKNKLIIRSKYYESLTEILEYGIETFGKVVTRNFVIEIKSKIGLLLHFPDANPKCRFIDSTENKTFRNIILKSHYIIYSVKNTEITVIDIIHQSVSPENMKKRTEN